MIYDAILKTLHVLLFPGAIHAFFIITTIASVALMVVLIKEKSIFSFRRKVFQNLDSYFVKIQLIVMLVSYLIARAYFSDETQTMMIGMFSFMTYLFIITFKAWDSLDYEMQVAFNHGKSWWDAFWHDSEKVESKYLKIETYHAQGSKIMAEYISNGFKIDEIREINTYVAETCEIIENLNEIFRKSLHKETTMLENKELLRKSYQELKDRYVYFEKKYHDLLQDHYMFKNPIAELIAKNMELEAQKACQY